jgi:hypothetical protein
VNLGEFLTDDLGRGDAVEIRHRQIREQHVRTKLPNKLDGGSTTVGFTNDL